MINNIHTLKEKHASNFLDFFKEEEIYIDDSDLCVDLEKGECEFTVIFENKASLNNDDRALLHSLLEKIVELDFFVANRMSPYEDYEFELSYVEIGKSVLFSYWSINVNSTWEFEFEVIREGEKYDFQSKLKK